MTETNMENGEDGGISRAGMEEILAGMRPDEPSAELMFRLTCAMKSAGVEQGEAVGEAPAAVSAISPVDVPVEKVSHWARLMDEASREVTEERLKKLKANQPPDFKLMRWLMSVENTSPAAPVKKSAGSRFKSHMGLWATSAAATFLAIFGVLSMYPTESQPSSLVREGDLNRETLNVVDEGMMWNAEKGVAEKKYHVDYQDTLELVDHNGNKINISVPSSQKVVVPVEIY